MAKSTAARSLLALIIESVSILFTVEKLMYGKCSEPADKTAPEWKVWDEFQSAKVFDIHNLARLNIECFIKYNNAKNIILEQKTVVTIVDLE